MRAGRWYFLVAVAAIVLLALLERLYRLPPLPFADADSWGYIRPAVLLFTEGEYVHSESREFVYPLFVHVVLRTLGSWSAVSAVQHVLGVAGGLLLLMAWLRIPFPRDAPPFLRILRGGLGLALLAAPLFLAQTMVYEHSLRPEALAQPVAAGILLGAVGLLGRRRGEPIRRLRLVADSALVVSSAALLVALRPQTLLVLPVALVVVVVVLVRLRPRAVVALVTLALPIALSVSALWIPDRVLARDDPRSGRFMSGVLFFWHFHLVDDVLEEDLRRGRLSPERRNLVRELLAAFEEERRRHAREGKWYHFQGYNPDALYYGEAGRILDRHFSDDSDAYEEFAIRTFLRGLAENPLGYARKVLVNLGNVYAWPEGRCLNPRLDFNIPRHARATLRVLEPHRRKLVAHPAGEAYLGELQQLRDELGRPDDPRSWVFGWKRLAKRVSDLYGILNGLYVPALVAGLLLFPLLPNSRNDPLVATFAVSGALAFATHLTPAMVHGLEVMRYAYGVSVLPIFTIFCGALLLALRVTPGRRHAAPDDPPLTRRGLPGDPTPGGSGSHPAGPPLPSGRKPADAELGAHTR